MTESFIAFVTHQFDLNARQEDGSTLRDHLASYEERTGRKHPMLADAPELPRAARHLWRDFLDLHGCRGSTMAGPSRITFSDIDAWQRVSGVRLEAWELAAIRRADDAFMDSPSNGRKGNA